MKRWKIGLSTGKEWGVPVDEIQRFRTATKELEWTVPGTNELGGCHGRFGSKRFHDELKNLIDNSKSLDEFNIGIIQLRDRWKIDPNLLPPLPKKT